MTEQDKIRVIKKSDYVEPKEVSVQRHLKSVLELLIEMDYERARLIVERIAESKKRQETAGSVGKIPLKK